MKTFFSLSAILISTTIQAQKTIDLTRSDLPNTAGALYSVGGQPFSNFRYVKVIEGSPYFKEEWMGGKVIMSGGYAYDSVYLRIDLVEHTLHFMGADGKEMIATSPIKAVILVDSVTGQKYQFLHSEYLKASGKVETGWYQLLAEGTATLLKRFTKTINENRPYGGAPAEQTILTFGNYFVMEDGVLSPVKKIKELPDLLKNKKEETKAFFSTKSLSGKKDADYISLVDYYNSIASK